MNTLLKQLVRFFGMNAPTQNVRVAMYRKAGVRIGKPGYFGSHNWIDITFRNMVIIGDDVVLAGFNHILSHSYIMERYKEEGFRPVIIKDGARIGIDVTILAGITIGENSVIGAGAVVNKDIPPNCLAVGVPAKPVKYFNKHS